MIHTNFIERAVALNFLDNDDLWQRSKVDGAMRHDLRSVFNNNNFFVASFVGYKLVGVTAVFVRQVWPAVILEVHTYVEPRHKKIADKILSQHVSFLKHEVLGDELVTSTSSKNMACHNFLIKRLGFKVEEVKEGLLTDEGKPLTVYDLRLKL